MEQIELNNWDEVTEYLDKGAWKPTPSYFEHIVQHGNYYPKDAFSKGQLVCKSWLLQALYSVVLQDVKIKFPLATKPALSNITVGILGSWIGTLVDPLHKTFNLERIYGIDLDPDAIEKSEKLNQRYVQREWKYKGVVADVSMLNCSNMQFETGGELITTKPNWIINTSCEHMDTGWFNTVSPTQLVIMQTNNSPNFDGHINPCLSINEMKQKYPMKDIRYTGSLTTPAYTRFMQIGYK